MTNASEGGLSIGATGTVCFTGSHTDAAPPIVPFVPTTTFARKSWMKVGEAGARMRGPAV